jgi:hypothetical protein
MRFLHSGSPFRIFGLSAAVTIFAAVAVGIIDSAQSMTVVLFLGVAEVALSFDNAIINAKTLGRMNEFWQKIFLTVGVLIAVFGMRLLLPVLIVSLTASLSPANVVDLALNHPGSYAVHLNEAHPAIAAFGGIFLTMIFLDFMFEERDVVWLRPLERALLRIGKLDQLSVILALVTLVVLSQTLGDGNKEQILVAGTLGLASYLIVNALGGVIGDGSSAVMKAGLGGFLYLEVVDASFSFDGVIGAFAITQKVLLIAVGLGIGAMFVRSLTVYLVRTKSLSKYCYLEHGAYWAIGFLAVCLLVSEKYHIPEVVTGGFAVIVIAAALLSSIYFGTVEQESMDEDETDDEPTAGTPDQQLALHLVSS